jgi:hypothetical protein
VACLLDFPGKHEHYQRTLLAVAPAGGLSLDCQRWVSAPKRYLVHAALLGTEWKLNIIRGIRQVHEAQWLVRGRLGKDRCRRIDIDLLLGHIHKKRRYILIGPSLQNIFN